MPQPRLAVFLVSALVITACTATAPVAQPAGQSAVAAEAAKSLKSAMKGIEEDFKLIEKAIETGSLGDQKALGAAADRCAAVMKLGYSTFEDKEVPNFATYSREAEAALSKFGQAATQGQTDKVLELGKTLQVQHCARCHDAVEKVHG